MILFKNFKHYFKNTKNIILLFLILGIILIDKINYKSKLKICLCVIGKNENLYAREFVEHYKKIGYNNIFIYDNNEKNAENFEEAINDYLKNRYVKIINYRDRKIDSRPQFDAYRDCYERYYKSYDWISFFDMDEFLELNKKYNSIQDFLNDKIFENCQSIKINWLMCNNENALYYENKTLQERIRNCNYNDFANKHIKTIVKGNLFENYWKKVNNPHTSILKLKSCSSSGKIIQYDSPFNYPPDFINAQLKHYQFKSFEEYCLKIKRGFGDHPKNESNEFVIQNYQKLKFENKNNKEKLKIIDKIFNKSI